MKARAKRDNRSADAEVHPILEEGTRPEEHLRMGDTLSALGRQAGLTDKDFATLEHIRDKPPAEPMGFE